MAFFRRIHPLVWFLIILGMINLVFIVRYAQNYFWEKSEQHRQLIAAGKAKTERFASEIEQKLPPVMRIAEKLADDLTHGRLDSTQLIQRLSVDVGKYDYVDGLFVAYKPFAYSPGTEYFAPLYLKSGKEHQLVFLEYDYTVNDWFQQPIRDGASWADPYFGKKSGEILIQYGVPIYDDAGEGIGIVAINLSPEELRKIVSSSLPPGESGYGFILSGKGTYIHHPIARLVQDQQTILEIAQSSGDNRLEEVSRRVMRGEEAMVETVDPLSGQKSRIFYQPIVNSNWMVGIHSFDERAANDYRQDSIKLIWMMIGTFSFIIILMVSLILLFQGSLRSYWIVSICTTLLFIAGIYFIWSRTMQTPPIKELRKNDLMIANEAVLQHFIEYQNEIARKTKQDVLYVPTGIFVQHIQFVGAYNVMLSGYVWQSYSKTDTTYSDGTPISRGFIFAETEPNAEVLDIEQAYSKDLGDREVIGWYFRVSVREEFDYRHYPFDQQRIWLRMWHKDFNRKVILIPDLESYKILNPVALPGMEKDFVLPQWSLRASYFDYKFNTYNTTFGVTSQFSRETKPELYFNIVARRKFLSPFITNIVPLIVVSVIVFTVLMSSFKGAKSDTFLGFSGFGVVELCAAFFFIVIISQIDIRNSLQVADFIYLDYFFFLIYLMLLAVSINSILFTRTDSIRFIEYGQNQIPKLIFWPVILGILLAITKAVFY